MTIIPNTNPFRQEPIISGKYNLKPLIQPQLCNCASRIKWLNALHSRCAQQHHSLVHGVLHHWFAFCDSWWMCHTLRDSNWSMCLSICLSSQSGGSQLEQMEHQPGNNQWGSRERRYGQAVPYTQQQNARQRYRPSVCVRLCVSWERKKNYEFLVGGNFTPSGSHNIILS
jgi:hypothetical protein